VDLGLRGKKAIVTASSQGIGKACALELAREGADVLMCARGEAALEAAREGVARAGGGRAVAVRADLSEPRDIDAVIAAAVREFGTVNVLVTNAGGPPSGRFEEFDDEAWAKAVALNLLSVVRLNRAVIPVMRRTGGGSIVNAVRAGVAGLSKTLATELGPDGIRVNVVCPGYTATDRMTELMAARAGREGKPYEEIARSFHKSVPLGRFAEPSDIARMVAFLASDAAAYVTGVTVQVDGGAVRGLL